MVVSPKTIYLINIRRGKCDFVIVKSAKSDLIF